MSNPALRFLESLVSEGLHPMSVTIEPGAGCWRVRVKLDDWAPIGEGGDSIPGHDVSVDRDGVPSGVSVRGRERFEDRCHELPGCTTEAAETMIREIAEAGRAIDYAQLGGAWLTKPIEWMREPMRSKLLGK